MPFPQNAQVSSNMKWLWLCGLMLIAAAAVEAQPSQIVLIRHAEKPDDDSDPRLSAEGIMRAQNLVGWVTRSSWWGTNQPTAVYAARPTPRGRSIRCQETVAPLALRLGLEVEMPYAAADYKKLATELIHDPKLRDRTVLVCWTHEYLPELAGALGVKPEPPKWKDKDFDSAYVVTFHGGKAQLERVRQSKTKPANAG
jgi:hypothetical protein